MGFLRSKSHMVQAWIFWISILLFSTPAMATNNGWWNFWDHNSSAGSCVSNESNVQNWQWQAGQSQLTLNGDAVEGGNSLILTQALHQAGTAFWTTPFPLYTQQSHPQSFSAAFSFRITHLEGISDHDGQGGDGLAFIINSSNQELGNNGSGLGYQGLDNSVTVEFDTYNNGWPDRNDGNHVALNMGGKIRSKHKRHVDQRLNNGEIWYAWVDYRGEKRKLEVRLSDSLQRPDKPFMSKKVRLPWRIGGSQAYVGFSSGTGDGGGQHEILNFEFITAYAPIGECDPPEFISEPVESAIADSVYSYDADAQDATPDDTLTYSLINAPSAMTIDSSSGLVNWLPDSQDVGEHTVELQVEDSIGLSARQSFTITVLENVSCGIEGTHTVEYENFSDLSAWQLNGSSAQLSPNDDQVLRLTDQLSQSGSAFLKQAIPLTDEQGFKASFSAAFGFKLSNPIGISDGDGQGADGLTFVVQTMDNNVGGIGGGIGYQGIDRSIGIEFDSWNNGAVDQHNGNHIGINLSGSMDSIVIKPIEQRFNDGQTWYAWVDYDGNLQQLKISFADQPARPAEPTLVANNIDLPNILQNENAFIGFTSGTGAAGGLHDVFDFHFTNTIAPIGDCGELAFSSVPQETIISGELLSYQTEVTGAAADAILTYQLITGPVSASIDSQGLLEWSSTGLGDVNFTVQVQTDNGEMAEQSFTLNVLPVPNQAPVALNSNISINEDTPVNFVLVGTDPDGDALNYVITSSVSNGILSGTAPNLSYLPQSNFNGADSLSFTVNDGQFTSTPATVSIVVNAVNDAPVVNPQSLSLPEDSSQAITLSGSDVEGSALTYEVQTNPTYGKLTGTAPNLLYTPDADFNGSDSFTFIGNDGIANSSAAIISLTVTAVNDAPVMQNQSLTTDEDVLLPVLLNATDKENDALSFTVVQQPLNGVLSGTAANLNYRPNSDFNGVDSFTVKANDGVADSNTATISITVNAINDVPVVTDQTVATDEDTTLDITLSGTDSDNDPLSFEIVSQTTNGSLSISEAIVSYTPDTHFNGADSFTYRANDGSNDSDIATISITVNAINDAPVVTDQSVSTDEDTAVDITLTATDKENDALIYSVLTQPANGTLTGTAPNLVYQPNAEFSGNDVFTFNANDGLGDSNSATVSIQVNAINDIPTADTQSLTTAEDTPVNLTLTGSDIDGDALSYLVQVNPTDGQLTGIVPNLVYTPNTDFNGSDSFTFVTNDGVLDSSEVTVTITVTSINDAPVIQSMPILNVTQGEIYNYQVVAVDPDTEDELVFQLLSAPVGMNIDQVTGAINWTPIQQQVGTFDIAIRVVDLAGLEATQDYSLTVEDVNDAPEIISDPVVQATEGLTYFYKVIAVDYDQGDTLTYSLLNSPVGMTIDQLTGEINWIPDSSHVGQSISIIVSVSDNNDSSDSQSYQIAVSLPFQIVSIPPETAFINTDYEYAIETAEMAAVQYELIEGPDNAVFVNNTLVWRSDEHELLDSNQPINSCIDYEGYIVGSPGAHALKVESFHVPEALPVIYGTVPLSITDTTDIENQKTLSALARDLAAEKWFAHAETFSYTTGDVGWTGFLTRLVVRDEPGEVLGFDRGTHSYFDPRSRLYNDRALAFHNDTVAARLSHDVCESDDDNDNNFGLITGHHNNLWERCVIDNWGEYKVMEDFGQSSRWLADLAIFDAKIESDQKLKFSIANRGLSNSGYFTTSVYETVNNQYVLIGQLNHAGLASNAEVELSFDHQTRFSGDIRIIVNEGIVMPECIENNTSVDLTKFVIKAVSPEGSVATQSFWVPTRDDELRIVSDYPKKIYQNFQYRYQIKVLGGSGDNSYQLDDSNGLGITVDSNGLIEWQVGTEHLGGYSFNLVVTDETGSSFQQEITIEVLETQDNTAPEIVSIPPKSLVVGQEYVYQIEAVDAEDDSFIFRNGASSSPASLDEESLNSGIVKWTPTRAEYDYILSRNELQLIGDDFSQPGAYQGIKIEVVDEHGLLGFHNWTVHLSLDETADVDVPQITNEPVTEGRAGDEYVYQVDVEDTSGTLLTYVLLEAPSGMTIGSSGLITWSTTESDIGSHLITFAVSNQRGGRVEQSYYLNLTLNNIENLPPTINSTPDTRTFVNQLYSYQLNASDPNSGDTINYRLQVSPNNMSIDSATGLINWVPSIGQVGSHPVEIVVSDINGGAATQIFMLRVDQFGLNQAPVINSSPPFTGISNIPYTYQIDAVDGDGDQLTYQIVSGPQGLVVDSDGLVTWLPTTEQVGDHTITIAVNDEIARVWQSYVLTVTNEAPALEIGLEITPKISEINAPVTISVSTVGGYGPRQTILEVNGEEVTLVEGIATYIPTSMGRYDVKVIVSDDIQSVEQLDFFTVRDDSDTAPPEVTIHTPANNEIVTNIIDVSATVQDDNLAEYRLVLIPANKPLVFGDTDVVARGFDNVTQTTIGQFDPTQLSNGIYRLFLIAEDVNGYETTESIAVIVEGDLKVGNFSITFEDLDIPLAGIPIQVTRTYDSRQKSEQLDFGYGWSIDYQNIDIHESRQPTEGWYQEQSNSTFFIEDSYVTLPSACTYSLSDRIVTVTLPNGDVEKFLTHARPISGGAVSVSDPNCTLLAGRFVGLWFEPMEGTYSELESLDGNNLYLTNVAGGNLALDIIETAPFDVKSYQLTTKTGYIYKLDQYFGIETITDPNGNTITYSDNGIVHSSGVSVDFDRDASGRITTITDPNGNQIDYSYDALGDLESVTDRSQAISTYSYDSNHGLVDMFDALGRRLIRNLYDNDGRLIAQEDNEGNRTDFNHDLMGKVSIVTNRRGYATQYQYDDRGNVLTEIDALGNTTQYTYDADDNQLSKTDALGNITMATYNAEGDQLTQVDALTNTTSYSYNSRSQELTITDPLDNLFENNYDDYGNLLSIIDPLGNIAISTIGAYGLPASVSNTLGHTTNYTYDNDGNKLSETDHLGNVTTWAYDDNGNPLTESRTRTDENGAVVTETTRFEYDALNRVIVTTDALGQVTRHEYDLVGNKSRDIDADGNVTDYDYDAYRRLTRISYADGTFENKDYDAEGNLISDTDRNSNVTSYDYDALNRQIRMTYQDGSFTQTEYDEVGNVITEIDERGNRTEYEYDAANRRILMRDASLYETSYTYDANGNLISMTDANGHTTQYEYDALDRRVKTIHPDLTESSTDYDALGQVISRTDQNGLSTHFDYDSLGRLISVTDAMGSITRYSYDEVGNKLTQADAENRTTSWSYDALGRETTRTLPLGQSESKTYDTLGNLDLHTDFMGQVTDYDHDSNSRVTSITYDDTTQETFAYDNNGNRTSATNRDNQSRTWAYDSRNRLTSDSKANGDLIEYGYDSAGNRTSLTLTPSAGTASSTSFAFDSLNRLQSVTNNNQTTTYTYNNVGSRASVTYPNGNLTEYVYDKLNRLTRLTTTDASLNTLVDFQYTLDNSGHRTQITEHSGRTSDYLYDDLYRLTSETITDNINGNYNATYEYDKVGNRTYSTIDGVQTAYTYDANDRLVQQGGETYQYDANGNTIEKTIDGETSAYSYDAKNHMAGANLLEGGISTMANYEYDIDGIRIGKTEDGNQIDYLVDHNQDYAQVLRETDQSAAQSLDYLYGDDLIRQSQDTSNDRYFLYDGLGSTRSLTDSNGATTDSYDYEAFGSTLNQTGATENNYLFTGEQYDHALDQQYLRARYYDPRTARFTQMDTWMGTRSDPITLHKYLYANSNPSNYIDPNGHFSIGSLMAAVGNAARLTTTAVAQVGSKAQSILKLGARAGKTAIIRVQYMHRVSKLRKLAQELRQQGKSSEEIAKILNKKRRALGRLFKNATDARTQQAAFERNIAKYGDKWGPTWQYLRKQGKSWDEIIESSARPNNSIAELAKIFFSN